MRYSIKETPQDITALCWEHVGGYQPILSEVSCKMPAQWCPHGPDFPRLERKLLVIPHVSFQGS